MRWMQKSRNSSLDPRSESFAIDLGKVTWAAEFAISIDWMFWTLAEVWWLWSTLWRSPQRWQIYRRSNCLSFDRNLTFQFSLLLIVGCLLLPPSRCLSSPWGPPAERRPCAPPTARLHRKRRKPTTEGWAAPPGPWTGAIGSCLSFTGLQTWR